MTYIRWGDLLYRLVPSYEMKLRELQLLVLLTFLFCRRSLLSLFDQKKGNEGIRKLEHNFLSIARIQEVVKTFGPMFLWAGVSSSSGWCGLAL